VQALQGHNHSPSIGNVVQRNKVTRWVKRRPFFSLREQLQPPELRIVTISGAAFRRKNETGLTVRGAQICLGKIIIPEDESFKSGDGHEQATVIGLAFYN